MPLFDDINVRNNDLVRKGMAGAVFVADLATPALTAITDTTGALVVVPAGWSPFGWISEDGVAWPRETEVSEIYGWGGAEPIRSDIRRATKRMTVTALETSRTVLEEFLGQDLSAVITASGGEGSFDEAPLPIFPYRRVLVIARDTAAGGEYYRGQMFLRAKVTETAEQTWQDSDTPVTYQITYTAFQDADEGTAVRHFFGGPGRVPEDEGFPADPGS
ncbi:MAG TPA: hypothetical protein VK735_39630 [Pseudonocardia sp.]|uniref:phage tail tube protein n=1 Tax=Pseudonocardia sp. TaxID=60912 RepID=UPI002C3ED943|nr:hypothetical protein [Pseudonocardia sp.]HTF53594.1 hypothetical protein [Pseudonocardia sp.]